MPPLPQSPPQMEEAKGTSGPTTASARPQGSWTPDLISPEEESSSAIETFDLAEDSSSDSITPDMDSQVLFIKLKEVGYKCTNALDDKLRIPLNSHQGMDIVTLCTPKWQA